MKGEEDERSLLISRQVDRSREVADSIDHERPSTRARGVRGLRVALPAAMTQARVRLRRAVDP
jgi:hypothetical protein